MGKTVIFTDSTAYIPHAVLERYGIIVAPQVLIWGKETFRDGVDIQPDAFYERLKTAKEMPSTSQVSPGTLTALFQPVLDAGNSVLGIFISGSLSGTMASAIQAKDGLPGRPIELVDSRTTAMAMGFQILAAARALESGASMKDAAQLARRAQENTGVMFVVDTLEFLHRGGRIGGAAKFLGTALSLKPLLEVREGKVEAIERVRTKTKALERMLDLIEERIAKRTPVRLATVHAAAPEEARKVLETAKARFSPVESFLTEASPVVGTHAGPGTVGLAYCAGL
jgi:fatty acid kinase fatty acid binding subunit